MMTNKSLRTIAKEHEWVNSEIETICPSNGAIVFDDFESFAKALQGDNEIKPIRNEHGSLLKIAKECGLLYEYGGFIGAKPLPTEQFITQLTVFAKALQSDGEPVGEFLRDIDNANGAFKYLVHQGEPLKPLDKLYTHSPNQTAKIAALEMSTERANEAFLKQCDTTMDRDLKIAGLQKQNDVMREALNEIWKYSMENSWQYNLIEQAIATVKGE